MNASGGGRCTYSGFEPRLAGRILASCTGGDPMNRWMGAAAIAVMVCAASVEVSRAADATVAEKMASHQTDRMKTDLGLTAEQVPQVLEINRKELSDFQQVMGKYKSDPKADRKAMIQESLAVSRARDAELQKMLTAQQWQSYKAGKPERTAEGMTRLMTVQLDLTGDQIGRVELINMTAVRGLKSTMSKDFQALPKREKIRIAREMKSILDAREQGLKGVLTAEQWKIHEKDQEQMKEVLKERLEERKG